MKAIKYLFVVLIFTIIGCWEWEEDGDGFEYYELSFIDNINSVIQYDSIHIVIAQTENLLLLRDTIPNTIIDNPELGDTIKLIVKVRYNTSSKNFAPIKEVNIIEDSLFLSYAYSNNSSSSLPKSSSINQAGIPPARFYNIEKIDIIKSPHKVVWLYSVIKSFGR